MFFSYSVRLRKEISRPAAGCGDVRVVIVFVSCRVTKCRLHCVLLLFLGNYLLQGKIGIDLVCVLLRAELQQQSLVDALQSCLDGLLGGVLSLRRGFKIGDVGLS